MCMLSLTELIEHLNNHIPNPKAKIFFFFLQDTNQFKQMESGNVFGCSLVDPKTSSDFNLRVMLRY